MERVCLLICIGLIRCTRYHWTTRCNWIYWVTWCYRIHWITRHSGNYWIHWITRHLGCNWLYWITRHSGNYRIHWITRHSGTYRVYWKCVFVSRICAAVRMPSVGRLLWSRFGWYLYDSLRVRKYR